MGWFTRRRPESLIDERHSLCSQREELRIDEELAAAHKQLDELEEQQRQALAIRQLKAERAVHLENPDH